MKIPQYQVIRQEYGESYEEIIFIGSQEDCNKAVDALKVYHKYDSTSVGMQIHMPTGTEQEYIEENIINKTKDTYGA